nr:ACP S-malonyltransferase [candidate division Zixibacteria bacterium]
MGKVAVVFPGQASQYVGMGKDFYESDVEVRRLYEIASDEIGEDIARLSFDGPGDTLTRTRFTQPAILLHSLAVLTVLKDRLPQADLTAGHSLGEYGSLALAGVIDFESAIKAVIRRASLMEEACRKNDGTMAAIMGLDEEKTADACREASAKGVVVPANFNSEIQIVISGENSGVEEACRLCKEKGAKKTIPLNVGGAFHSPLMESACDGMKDYLEKVEYQVPRIDIVTNVTGEVERDPEVLKSLQVKQLTAPVRWYHTLQYFGQNGIDTVIEIGPGKVLVGLAKRELKSARLINLDTLKDLEELT